MRCVHRRRPAAAPAASTAVPLSRHRRAVAARAGALGAARQRQQEIRCRHIERFGARRPRCAAMEIAAAPSSCVCALAGIQRLGIRHLGASFQASSPLTAAGVRRVRLPRRGHPCQPAQARPARRSHASLGRRRPASHRSRRRGGQAPWAAQVGVLVRAHAVLPATMPIAAIIAHFVITTISSRKGFASSRISTRGGGPLRSAEFPSRSDEPPAH